MVQRDIGERVWRDLLESRFWEVEGQATNLVRWWQLIEFGMQFMEFWHEAYLAQLYACIECDLLHGKAFDKLLRERAAAQTKSLSGPHDDAARMRESTEQQRTLQKSCANLLVTSTMFLGESRNQSVERSLR